MEKINQRKEIKDFPPTTLYLNDLVVIVDMLAKVCKEIKVESGDYRVTDPAEINDLAKKFTSGRFNNIRLQGHSPYISLDFYEFGIYANIEEDSAEQRGLIEKIRDVVIKGKKKDFSWFYQIPAILFFALGVMTIVETKDYVSGILLIVVGWLCVIFGVLRGMRNKVSIHSENRGASKSFFERNKDEFIKKLIYAACTGIGLLIMYLFQRYFPGLLS